ncbi:phage tail protein [Enterococcus dispar]|uniref:phage tail protein n=1 Tax=Enterococcus dispar TaxID=44009 RepID=UPI0021D41F1D|nr:phage tail protein [Enterococcus dispar]MCU7356248.1 phage tail protein [Enterococcus dispar]
MKIYVMTKADETVAILDNSLSGALHYFDDEFHRYLETGASTFDLSIAKKHMMYSNASTGAEDDFQYLKENHFLVFTYKNRDYKFTIRRVEETESSLRLFCEDLSFDLLNEYRGPYKADKAYHISKYVNDCLVDSGYEIGINEFTKNTRTLKWEGDDTVLKRLLSICNSFDAEIEFETILNDDRTVDKQLVHLRKRVGMDRPDVELKYGRDVSSIRRNVDVTELITAIKPRGHEEDNKIVTIKNVEKEIKDENGNVVFYTKKGSEYICAPMANQEYGNPKRKGGGYIVGQFSYDTKSDTELFNRALTELQKKCVPAYEFEIEGFYDIDIGDTIRAIDEGYNPILLLEARISEQTISFSDPTKNKTVYSNYRILQNKVSQSLLDRIDEVKKYAEQVAKTYIFSISNVGSPMFRNGEGEVIFTAKIEKNNQDMTGEFTKFNWIKQKKDGSLDTIWNAAHQGIGKSITVKPEDFEDTATFSYEALQDDLSIGGASGVVTKVYDGENGKTPYTHYAYAWSADGTDRFTDTYPNENLARTMALSGYNTDASNTVIIAKDKTVISCVGRQHIGLRIWDAEKKLKANTTYYFQFDFKVTSGSVARIGGHLTHSFVSVEGLKINGTPVSGVWANGIAYNFVNGTTYHIEFKATSKANPDEGTQGMFIQPNRATYGISYGVEISKLKQEESMSPTIYTPSPLDDFENAYPTYSGTYTDYTAQDSQNPADYVWSRILGNGGQNGNDGVGIASTAITYQASASGTTAPTGTWSTTIPSVPAGQFLWIKTVTTYTNNTNSTAYTVAKMGSDGKPGSNGISVSSVVEEYYVSTSPTSQSGGAWSTTVPNNADPNKYIWRRLKTTMSNGTVTYTNPALIQGMTGIYPYIGPTQPANPKEGQQWWKSDASGNVTNFYVYKSGSWQGQTIQQSVLNIIELNAVTITGSTITGTKINGGVISGTEIHSGFYTLTYKDAPLYIPGSEEKIYGKGAMFISLGEISDSCTVYKEGSTVPLYDTFMHLNHNKIVFFKNAPAPSYQRLKQVEIGYDGLYITNEENFPGYNAAKLTFQDLMVMPATLIQASTGFSQYATSGDNAPLVSRQGRVVQLSGAFKNNAVIESGASGTMGTLPVWARPERAVLMRVQASYNNTYLLTVNTNGTITMSRHAAGANNAAVPAGSWLNIAIVYAAADI